MNDAVFAIPGLMPPKAPKWSSIIHTPEDGSLVMLIHAGKATDKVSYAVKVRGVRPGTIKDPEYLYVGGHDATQRELPHQATIPPKEDRSNWPDFLSSTTTLPSDIIIPKRVRCGCPIPLNELPHLQDIDEVWYWILTLPPRALPMGDSEVEACVNGKVRSYIIQRPAFAVHRRDGITERYSDYKAPTSPQDEELVQIDISSTKGGYIRVSGAALKDRKAVAYNPDTFEYRLILTQNHSSVELSASYDQETDTISADIPAEYVQIGIVKIILQYNIFGSPVGWLPLTDGDYAIVK